MSETANEQVEGAGEPGEAEPGAVEEQLSLVGEPLHGEQVESLAEPEGWVAGAGIVVLVRVTTLFAQSLVQGA